MINSCYSTVFIVSLVQIFDTCTFTYLVLCAIWYHSYNLKKVKDTHGGVLKSNTPPWVFLTFFKLYEWYQIAQSTTYLSQTLKTTATERRAMFKDI